jgi:cell division protein FtsL
MNGFASFLGRSLRGSRLIEFGALLVLLTMVLGVYLAKASAGRERGDITAVQQQIDDEQRRLRLLQAEVAHLEEPERLERLSAEAGLGPTNAKHEGAPEELSRIAEGGLATGKPAKAAPAATTQAGFEAQPVTVASVAKVGAPR